MFSFQILRYFEQSCSSIKNQYFKQCLACISLYSRRYNVRVEDIMLRNIPFVTLNTKYRELQELLTDCRMKSLALVETAGKID